MLPVMNNEFAIRKEAQAEERRREIRNAQTKAEEKTEIN